MFLYMIQPQYIIKECNYNNMLNIKVNISYYIWQNNQAGGPETYF